MRFEFSFDLEPMKLLIEATTDQPATLVDWILVLEDLQVQMKANFAKQIADRWNLTQSLSDTEKHAVLGELDKLQGPHPNQEAHDKILNDIVMDLVNKLELKQNMEHLN